MASILTHQHCKRETSLAVTSGVFHISLNLLSIACLKRSESLELAMLELVIERAASAAIMASPFIHAQDYRDFIVGKIGLEDHLLLTLDNIDTWPKM